MGCTVAPLGFLICPFLLLMGAGVLRQLGEGAADEPDARGLRRHGSKWALMEDDVFRPFITELQRR